MDWEYFVILTILISFLIFLVQRTEASRRLFVIVIMIIPGILLRNFAVYREIETEAWAAFFTGLILNFLFWLLIGRYNPVGSSDEIQVLGMDD